MNATKSLWNPAIYGKLKALHLPLFNDLLRMVTKKPNLRVVDLGCGTGEFTRHLADTLPDSDVLGIDSSQEMIREAQAYARQGLRFQWSSIEEVVVKDTKWDLIFSHASLQWVDDHRTFLPQLVNRIAPGGQLALQMVMPDAYFYKKELDALASRDPFRSWTWTVPMLSSEAYADIMFQNGGTDVVAVEKVYPQLLQDVGMVFEYAEATTMNAYLQRLPLEQREAFKEEYRKVLWRKYPQRPLFFPQKRLFLTATF